MISESCLADFGIARWVDDVSGLTATNMTVGTVSYAAPEQLMGGALDGRADQYALAATAFHLLTGAPPFQHSNPAVVISQHLSGVTAGRSATGAPSCRRWTRCWPRRWRRIPRTVIERCADFARALAHRLGAADGDVGTTLAFAAKGPKRSLLRAGVVVPAILAVLLIAGIALAVKEFHRVERPEPTTPTANSPTSPTVPFPPPEPVQPPPHGPTTDGGDRRKLHPGGQHGNG